jgi:dTDP-4-dehydrorhamnose 3,5-epimerase
MVVKKAGLDGVLVIEPNIHKDNRGYFLESFNHNRYSEIGIENEFVQDNLSFSNKNVLRGLHFQNPKAQAKLVFVIKGEVFDVVVDIRNGSPTFGLWEGFILSEKNKRQVYIPEGFAHGFVVLSDEAFFYYKCSTFYSPQNELCIRWNDDDIGIDWKVNNPIISDKDLHGMFLKDINIERLLKYRD